MYSDLNAAGRLFGGRLMAWIDEATAMAAMRIMGTKRVVTKKFGEIVFEAPGMLGDFVEIWCRPEKRGDDVPHPRLPGHGAEGPPRRRRSRSADRRSSTWRSTSRVARSRGGEEKKKITS